MPAIAALSHQEGEASIRMMTLTSGPGFGILPTCSPLPPAPLGSGSESQQGWRTSAVAYSPGVGMVAATPSGTFLYSQLSFITFVAPGGQKCLWVERAGSRVASSNPASSYFVGRYLFYALVSAGLTVLCFPRYAAFLPGFRMLRKGSREHQLSNYKLSLPSWSGSERLLGCFEPCEATA